MRLKTLGEEAHQACLFRWAALHAKAHPELDLLFHVPNGGYRSKATAGRFKAMGVKPGYPDIALDVPRLGFNGLRIELKRAGGRLSLPQRKWLEALRMQGYHAVVCVGWEEAAKEIAAYLAFDAGL